MSTAEIRATTAADDPLLLDLFQRAGLARSAEELAWRRANPAGLHAWIAVREGRALAHCGVRRGQVISDGAERIYGELVDAVCDPGAEDGEELLRDTAQALLRATHGPDEDLVTYGWIDEAGWTLALNDLKFEVTRIQSVLERDPQEAPPAADVGLEVSPLVPAEEGAADEVAELYGRCRGAWESSSVRNAAFLRWRFLARPDMAPPTLLAVREPGGGTLRGYLAARTVDSPAPGTILVVDWLAADDDEAAGTALRDALLDLGRASGAPHVAVSFPEWSPWFARFQEAGFLVRGTGLRLATRKVHPRHETYWLRDAWWYQPAEFEVV